MNFSLLEFNPKSKEKDIKINGYQLIHKGEYVASNDIPNKENYSKTDNLEGNQEGNNLIDDVENSENI